MVWFYIVIAVVGIVVLVPTVLQSIDGVPPHLAYGFIGFAATTFGVAGAVVSQFPTGPGMNLIAAIALGLAAGAVHPEVTTWLARRNPAATPEHQR